LEKIKLTEQEIVQMEKDFLDAAKFDPELAEKSPQELRKIAKQVMAYIKAGNIGKK
jgi:hypothetical protein